MMRKLTVLCALAVLFNVSHAAAAQGAPPRDPNDVVAQVLNYSSFGNTEGSGGAYWYQDNSDKCKYKLFDPTPVGSPEIDLNALDPRNITFREALTDSGVTYTILEYDPHPLLPGASPYFLKLDLQRLQRGWSLIYSKYCTGKRHVS